MSRIRTISVLALLLAAGCDRAPLPSEPASAPSARKLVTGTVRTVTNTNDAGPGSLRQTIADAASGDVIEFAAAIAGQTVTLTSFDLVINKALTIVGSPTLGMTIDGGLATRVFFIGSGGGDATLRNLTITRGISDIDNGGGGIFVRGKVTLDHSTVSGNLATQGSTVGGGIYGAEGSEIAVINSTISGNRSGFLGSGVFAFGILTLENATIAANHADDGPAVVIAASVGSLSKLQLTNSVIAENTNTSGGEANCNNFDVQVSQSGRSLIASGDCATGADILTANANLGPLAGNGGPTKTHALLAGSAAIDAAKDCTVSDDQRYVSRPQPPGPACDLGAYEFDDYPKVAVAVGPSVAVSPSTGVAIITGSMTCSKPASVSLDATLTQTQRNARTTVVASATSSMVVNCIGVKAWSLSLAPPTGAFQNGSATAALATSSTTQAFSPAASMTTVKMYWAHK